MEDVEAHFEELTDSTGGTGGPVGAGGLTQNAVVGGTDPSFASTYVNAPPQGLEHLSLGVMNQSGGSALLSSTLGVVRHYSLLFLHFIEICSGLGLCKALWDKVYG